MDINLNSADKEENTKIKANPEIKTNGAADPAAGGDDQAASTVAQMLQNVNYDPWRPAYSLLYREILRFATISTQTVFTPVVTATLYLLVFGVSLGERVTLFPEVKYLHFVIPGLMLMGVAQNAFANSSSSIFMARYLGYIVDFLVAPLSPSTFILAYTVAAMLRGLVVGMIILLVSLFFAALPWPHPEVGLAIIILVSFIFSQFGIIAGIMCHTFDSISLYTSFILLPLIYLGGLFYPAALLPTFWRNVSYFNPLLYLMDGFRYAALGINEIPIWFSLTVATLVSVVLYAIASGLIRGGYNMRE